jgi:hypothetical protein
MLNVLTESLRAERTTEHLVELAGSCGVAAMSLSRGVSTGPIHFVGQPTDGVLALRWSANGGMARIAGAIGRRKSGA